MLTQRTKVVKHYAVRQ